MKTVFYWIYSTRCTLRRTRICLFIYLFIYKIRHQQNKDKTAHREELQLRDPKIYMSRMLPQYIDAVFSGTKVVQQLVFLEIVLNPRTATVQY